jgi:uncharacterized BrkB/YihY/UPF0761 family membrane protein
MIVGKIDLNVGFGIVLWHILAITLQVEYGVSWQMAVLTVLAISALYGLLNGILVALADIDSFVATLGSGTVLYAIALWHSGGRQIVGDLPDAFIALHHTEIAGIPIVAFYVLIVAVVLLAIGMIIMGGEASQRIGEFIGIPVIAFHAWNVVKWPILLVILIIGVSLAYYSFPNVRLPRYRLMTLGSTLSVLTLFGTALFAGQLLVYATRFAEILTALNGLIAILLLMWLANIVVITGAALDAEFLRARQIASGLDAWHGIVLAPHATHTLDFLARDADEAEELGREVAEAVRSSGPLRRERSAWIVDASNPLAVNPPRRHRVTSDPLPDPPAEEVPAPGGTAPEHPTDPPSRGGSLR